ncbi:DUF2309 domain-containing protein [Sphingomonas humi]|uniref:Probable inorganic carbon transporter subunit DabA n=1 Tax=Sphingomonas humi TaxID=335630 RepID=A0ABP7SEN6_9SPHN
MTNAILAAADQAARAIPPLWPLASSVAVNPFLGQSEDDLATASVRLRRAGGVAITMPRAWFAERIAKGDIADIDLADAMVANGQAPDVAAFKQETLVARRAPVATSTIADLAAEASDTDWPALVAERVSHWAAGWFDQGQALWPAPAGRGAYAAWRAVATHDLTPEIAGLTGFAATVADLPEQAEAAMAVAVAELGLSEKALPAYFHRLLLCLGGWAQAARYRLWQAELRDGTDGTTTDLVAIMLVWELALKRRFPQVGTDWERSVAAFAEPIAATAEDRTDAILQEAAERAAQRKLAVLFAGGAAEERSPAPALQVAFCIDVRSEVFRRALESLDPGIQTIGFAGFFGLGVAHRRFGSDTVEARLPVLLNPGLNSIAGGASGDPAATELSARIAARAKRAWGRFRLAAVSSFAFVEATGPLYIAKLVRDALSLSSATAPDDLKPRLDPPLDPVTRLATAETVLRAMSLTRSFARLVLLAGHGATVVNNPHASALHCGACGGYSGEVNARLLADLLNDPHVRDGLKAKDIVIPQDTLFLGALHDTTTDVFTIYADDFPSAAHAPDVRQAHQWLRAAGAFAACERAARLPRANDASAIAKRARNWAEVRPEWALAGCKAFVAAPRHRTAGKDLEGRAFLHDYNWREDAGFDVLEMIITAPVVVASWISLQYYGSTVAPDLFGAGNKLLHNVTGGLGVVEGNGGLLRPGLPLQSISEGKRLVHEPLRLSVLIEAPREAISDVLSRHPAVRALFDNKWLHLFALDEAGRMAWRYAGDLQWIAMDAAAQPSTRELVAA